MVLVASNGSGEIASRAIVFESAVVGEEYSVPSDPARWIAEGGSKDTVTVEDAVFGLAAHHVDGREALVPSWLFEVRAPGAKDPFTMTHPAVDPEYLTSPTPPAGPTEQPSPRPTGPDAERTAKPRDVAVGATPPRARS